MKRKYSGFTLVELLAVIAVLAVILIIAIPAIMSVTTNAKKELFYEFAQSVQGKAITKYTQDTDKSSENINCAVYDIKTDLGISDVGSYEGWVRVDREAISGGVRNVFVKFTSAKPISYAKYCITKNSTCDPNETYFFEEGSKNVTISKLINSDEKMCANYQYGEETTVSGKLETVLKTSSTQCVDYASGTDTNTTYKYNVIVTLKDSNFAVENLTVNDEMSIKKFYQAIDTFNHNHSDLVINKPSCLASDTESKGTTTTKTTIASSLATNETKTTNVVTSTSKTPGVTNVSTTTTSNKGSVDYSTTTTTEKSSVIASSGSTTSRPTTINTTEVPEVDISNTALLLNNLYISNYYIDFSPIKFIYELDVPNGTTSLSISASPAVDTTEVKISGNDSLGIGVNNITVSLSDPLTGKSSVYLIKVNRLKENITHTTRPTTTKPINYDPSIGKPDPTIEASDASLAYLMVSGYVIRFNPNVYNYTLETNGEDTLSLSYRANNRNAIVQVNGAGNVTDGSNITVYVQSENGYYNKTYTINIKFKEKKSTTKVILRWVVVGLGGILLVMLVVIWAGKIRRPKINLNKIDNNQKQG